MKKALLGFAAFMLAPTPALLAHHSFAAEYDSKKPVTLKGIVTRVEPLARAGGWPLRRSTRAGRRLRGLRPGHRHRSRNP